MKPVQAMHHLSPSFSKEAATHRNIHLSKMRSSFANENLTGTLSMTVKLELYFSPVSEPFLDLALTAVRFGPALAAMLTGPQWLPPKRDDMMTVAVSGSFRAQKTQKMSEPCGCGLVKRFWRNFKVQPQMSGRC